MWTIHYDQYIDPQQLLKSPLNRVQTQWPYFNDVYNN